MVLLQQGIASISCVVLLRRSLLSFYRKFRITITIPSVANYQNVLPISCLIVVSLCIIFVNQHHRPLPMVAISPNPLDLPSHIVALNWHHLKSFTICASVAKYQSLPIFCLTVVSLCILLNSIHAIVPCKWSPFTFANLLNLPLPYHFIQEPLAHMRESTESLSASSSTSSFGFRIQDQSNTLFHHIPIHGTKFPFMVSSHSWQSDPDGNLGIRVGKLNTRRKQNKHSHPHTHTPTHTHIRILTDTRPPSSAAVSKQFFLQASFIFFSSPCLKVH
jgi:hypothetical protein